MIFIVISENIDVDPISEKEVIVAIKQLKNGKSAGVDGIQLELLKYSDSAVPHLTDYDTNTSSQAMNC